MTLVSSMQRSPVDDIIDKIVAELLKLNQVDYVSQSTFNSMSEIVKTCAVRNWESYMQISEILAAERAKKQI